MGDGFDLGMVDESMRQVSFFRTHHPILISEHQTNRNLNPREVLFGKTIESFKILHHVGSGSEKMLPALAVTIHQDLTEVGKFFFDVLRNEHREFFSDGRFGPVELRSVGKDVRDRRVLKIGLVKKCDVTTHRVTEYSRGREFVILDELIKFSGEKINPEITWSAAGFPMA